MFTGGGHFSVLTQSGRFFGLFRNFGPRSVWTLPKSCPPPPISDVENSKIKVSWPNETVAWLSEVPNTGIFQEICCYWSSIRTGFSPCLAQCSNISSLWQISARVVIYAKLHDESTGAGPTLQLNDIVEKITKNFWRCSLQ